MTDKDNDTFEIVLTDEQIIAAWDAQWRHHGHEPCKLGHLEFGRTVEVMVASRCRAQGGSTNDNVSSVLAQAGARAEPVGHVVTWNKGGSGEVNSIEPIGKSGYSLAASLPEGTLIYTAAPTTPAQVPAAEVRAQALAEVRAEVRHMQNHLETYGPAGEEAARVALDGVLDIIEEIEDSYASTADKASEVRAAEDVEYELHQDDMMVAGTSGKDAFNEILRYAAQYVQDGPIELYKVTRTKVSKLEIPVAAPSTADSGNTDEKGAGK